MSMIYLEKHNDVEIFESIFIYSPLPCLFFNDEGILECNEAAVKLLRAGCKEDILSKHPSVFLPDFQPDGMSSRAKSEEMDRLAQVNGFHRFEWMHRTVDGTDLPVEVTLTPIKLGNAKALLTQWRDLSEQRAASANLEKIMSLLKSREEYFRGIYRDAPMAIIELNQDMRFMSANPAYSELVGYSEAELKEKSISDITHPDDIVETGVRASDASLFFEPLRRFQKRYLHKSGRVVWASVTAKLLARENNEVRFIAVIDDITELKMKELEIASMSVALEKEKSISEQNAKLASLGEMAGGISHEINNPLAILQGRINKARRKFGEIGMSGENVKEMLGELSETTERIAKIIKGLSALSRNSHSDPHEDFLVREVVSDVLALCSEKFRSAGIGLRVQLQISEFETLRGSSVQISQVLINLLNNAFDAVVGTPSSWIEVGASTNEFTISFWVKNSGPRIRDEIALRIMEPFFTTKSPGKGTGLGLSISKKIIESHKGKLFLEDSSPTPCFQIVIPKS